MSQRQNGWCCGTFQIQSSAPTALSHQRSALQKLPECMQTLDPDLSGLPVGHKSKGGDSLAKLMDNAFRNWNNLV